MDSLNRKIDTLSKAVSEMKAGPKKAPAKKATPKAAAPKKKV